MTKLFLLMTVIGITGLPWAHAQGDRAPFSIIIGAERGTFQVGAEVRIQLVLRNTSSQDLPYVRGPGVGVESRGEVFTDVEVRNSKGELAPKTKYYRDLRGEPEPNPRQPGGQRSSAAKQPRTVVLGSFVGSTLRPGDSRTEDIVVSRLYDLSEPGQYSVTASRRLSDDAADPNSKLTARSNTLTITITR